MLCVKKTLSISFIMLIITAYVPCFSFVNQIDGLNFQITKIDNFPLDKAITKEYDLYELYLENNTHNTYSIPGYSIDFGVEHFNILELSAQLRGKISSKLAIVNIAAAALFLPLGSFARNAGRTAVSSVSSFKRKNLKLYDNENLLSADKIYILYPMDSKVLYFLVLKEAEVPMAVRFVCRDEELGINHVVINNGVSVGNVVLQVSGKFNKKYEADELPLNRDVDLDDSVEFEDELLSDPAYIEYK